MKDKKIIADARSGILKIDVPCDGRIYKVKKNRSAVALSKKRMDKISPERRSEIARNAAKVRWERKTDEHRISSIRRGNSERLQRKS